METAEFDNICIKKVIKLHKIKKKGKSMEIEDIIQEFLDEFGYAQNKDIEGVILYGSYQTKTNKKNSDVDIIIVYNSESKKETTKEYKKYKNYDFESYERTLQNLYDRVDKDFLNYEDTMLSAIGYGEIIEDRNGKIKELQNYTLQKYKNGLPKLNEQDVIYGAKSIHKSIESLKNMYTEKSPYYSTFYAITLDKIRDYYNKKNGYSNMSTSKVYRLYTDEVMQTVQHKFMPEKQFTNSYLNCIETNEFEKINDLFKYVTRDISADIDYYNIKFNIGNRNH